MKIERPDPAVAALQLMARIPAPEPAVNQARMAQNAGLEGERNSQGAYSNLLKARLLRLEKLRVISETAGKYAAVVHRMAQDGADEETVSGMAGAAADSLAELLMEANAEGPPIFPPLPSPLARSRRSLAGYLKQMPDPMAPPPGSEEAEAVQSASTLIMGHEGILAALRSAGSGLQDEFSPARLEVLARHSEDVSEQISSAAEEMKTKTELLPSEFDHFSLAG